MPKSLNREVELMVSSIDRCEMVNEQEISNLARTHVAHRPWQVESLADLELLDRLGERTVITQQDLIGYHTPAVFEDRQRWLDYRRTTADALGLASSTIFYTRHAADDAIREDLVDEQRVHIAPLAPPTRATLPITTQRPAALDEIAEPFLLVLGNRFRHKNGRFAQELVSVLRSDHGWDGHLVFAGAEVLHGSGSGDDAAWRLKHPGSDSYIHELGAVGEANKAWLLCNAAGVVYPTTNEGWGLVPAEANNAGVPCLFAPVSALAETMPSELALLQPWNAAESAARVRPVLEEGDARTDFLNRMTAALGDKTWDQTADRVVDAYRAAVSDPVPPAAVLRADMVANESRYWAARDALSGDAWKLVGPDDPLLDEEATRLLVSIVRSTRQLRWLKGVLARRARLRSMLRR
jgi:putative NIF3 family GTP cyclohydrolase 1 type 2